MDGVPLPSECSRQSKVFRVSGLICVYLSPSAVLRLNGSFVPMVIPERHYSFRPAGTGEKIFKVKPSALALPPMTTKP